MGYVEVLDVGGLGEENYVSLSEWVNDIHPSWSYRKFEVIKDGKAGWLEVCRLEVRYIGDERQECQLIIGRYRKDPSGACHELPDMEFILDEAAAKFMGQVFMNQVVPLGEG